MLRVLEDVIHVMKQKLTTTTKNFSSTTWVIWRNSLHWILKTPMSQNLNWLETHLPLTSLEQ